MVRSLLAFLFLSLLCCTAAAAAPSILTLDSGSLTNEPVTSIIEERNDKLTLEFTLPALQVEEIAVGHELYHALTIPGGQLKGLDGRAGLPVITRLVAIPDGAAASVRVLDKRERSFEGYRVFPVQPDEGEAFTIDRAWYAGGDRAAAVPVELGKPGILRDLRVVPVTFSPVDYDPVSGEIRVAESMTVEIDFSGSDPNAETPGKRALIPESFDNLYRDTIVNYRSEDVNVGPGTYLMICNPSVTANVAPLLDWRRRQGYNVILETTTSTSANTVKSIIQGHYDSANPPLEFVCLVGDANGSYYIPTFHEYASSYSGEGDHSYTRLDGTDMLADVNLGRLSVSNTTELNNVVAKIVGYETDPPTSDSGWFTRATLVGDPTTSGISCVMVNQWVKHQLLNLGYSQVDTIWGGNFPTLAAQSINQGVSVFGYRGYYGMSNISSSVLGALSNGRELPFAVIPTCDTGSFEADGACRSEAILRNGNGGAVAAIGTATIGTHTRYNNCFFLGTWEGAINGSDHRVGVAHARGKLELYNNYSDYESSVVEIWSTWNSLMGDPATNMWTRYPYDFTVDYPATLPVGAVSVPVRVKRGLSPVANALVAVYKSGEISATAYTDSRGEANIPISGGSAGTLLVTVTKDAFIPHRGDLTLGAVAAYPAYAQSVIDDDASGGSQGNGDHTLNPGETIELSVALRNFGTSAVSNITATIATTDAYVTISDDDETFGAIAAGATVWGGEDFDLAVAADTPDGHVVRLNLVATDGSSTWTSAIDLTVGGAAFDYEGFVWGGDGSTLDPGEAGSFSITVRNSGSLASDGTVGALAATSDWVTVTDASGGFGDIAAGATGSGGFALSISSDCFQGHLETFVLTLTDAEGAVDVVEFTVPVGTASSDDPVGPDPYGYYAFDNTDTGYTFAPAYDWIEIDPNYGGGGSDAGLSDLSYEDDDIVAVALPFPFTYYGQTYDEIFVCSNGFVSFTETPVKTYRNWTIPGAENPDGLVAVFWDNLVESGGNQVYTWHDAANQQFIVQWSRMRNYIHESTNDTQNVQLVLKDPSAYPTSTGDGMLLMQYETVSNSDYRDGYATVGIQNPKDFSGVLYTYGNDYAPGAATLAAGRAILFMPIGDMHLGTLEGTITSNDTGAGLSGVPVQVVENNQTITSASGGHYEGGVEAGTYTVRVAHESFDVVTYTDVVITEDLTTVVNFQLDDILGPYILDTTELPITDDTTGPYTVDTWITDFTGLEEIALYYKRQGGVEQAATLTLVDAETGHYRGEIPGQAYNSHILYWIEAEDPAGNASRDPESPLEYHEFYVVETVVDFDDDMESDLGWQVNVEGTDTATSGVWERAEPYGVQNAGEQVCPEYDASDDGTLCWITGNSENGNQGTDDVDGGVTTLYSPVFDLSEAWFATLDYRRWFTNDTGFSPGEDNWTVKITDDGSTWTTLEQTLTSDRSWSAHSFDLGEHIDFTSHVQIAFVASDTGGGSVVEAGVDEVRILAFREPVATAVPDGAAPAALTLAQNMPNPFNPTTEISFGLPHAQNVALRIYDVSGRLVKTLVNDRPLGEGFHSVTWNGTDDRNNSVGSGVYFYVLSGESAKLTAKMTLLK